MNFLDLQNLTAYWLDDLNFGYFTKPQVKFWLNNAQKELQKQLLQSEANYYLTCVQTTLVQYQQDYVLPSDFLHLHRLEIVNSGTPPNEDVYPLAPITVNQQDLVASHTGTPQFYFLKKNRVRVMPAPDTPLTLRLFYSYLVTDMVNDTDIPDAPDAFHEFIPVLATIDGLLKDGRDMSGALAKRAYYEDLLKKETQERYLDAPRSIVQTGNDMTGSFGYF